MNIPQPMMFAAETGGGVTPAAAQGAGDPPPSGGSSPPPASTPAPDPGAPAAAPYWPEGLDQAFKAPDGNSTLDNLAKAIKGYRDRDARIDRPEKPEGYLSLDNLQAGFTIEPALKGHFDTLAGDPAFKSMAERMHHHGLGRTAAFDIYQSGLLAMQKAGLLEPPIDYAAEQAALVPETAKSLDAAGQKQASARRMQENFDFLALQEQNGGLDKGVREYAETMLGDTANGHKFIEWLKGKLQGGGPGPSSAGLGGKGDTREGLKAEMAALNQGDPKYAEKHKALDERYKRLIGD